MAAALPLFAPFPESATWRQQIPAAEWTACLDSWLSLVKAHIALPDAKFASISLKDESVPLFLTSVVRSLAQDGPAALGPSSDAPPTTASPAELLKRGLFVLIERLLKSPKPPSHLLQWEFLSDFCHLYGKRRAGHVLGGLPAPSIEAVEASLSGLKKLLIKAMDAGLHADLKSVEERLRRVNYLISAWPAAGVLFLAGSDYLDALISCFKIMNPPLRRCIVTNAYLCLVNLTEGTAPRYSQLSDVLYSLRGAAEEHKKGPLNQNDSVVAELVTTTPILEQIQQRAEASGTSTSRILPVLKELAQYRKAGAGRLSLAVPAQRRKKRKVDKGKSAAALPVADGEDHDHLHAHKLSQITQVQDLFPDLGSAFVAKLLDEYNDDTEQVVAHLLEGTLPAHLEAADRAENLPSGTTAHRRPSDLAPHPTPPLLPSRHNVFDDDELDTLLAAETAKLHFGKRQAATTADDVLRDRASGPKKAAILSALAAFDSDDDERDDTYDAADVGGTVDKTTPGGDGDDLQEATEQALFAAYQAAPKLFARDATTRRGAQRERLKEETGMTDEAIEGWAVMLARNPQQRRRLEAKFTAFTGAQIELARTAWRAESGDDDSGTDGAAQPRGGGRGGRGRRRGGRGGGGGGRGGGNVAGPTGERETEQARRRKEAHKGSRANHNRRDQRAKKMARGGFPG